MSAPQTLSSDPAMRIAELLRRQLSVIMIVLAGSFFYLFWTTGRTALAIPVSGATIGGIVVWTIIQRYDVQRLFQEPTELTTAFAWRLTQPKIAVGVAFLYTATILVLHSISLYERPTISYPLHGAIFAYIATTIYYQDNKVVTFLQLVPVAFATYWSAQLLFPSGTSRVGRYSSSAQLIFQEGTVPPEITYAETPGFFILSGAFHEITTLSARDGHLFVAVLIVTSTIVMLLCLGRVFPSITSRVAQLSALVFATTAFTVARGVLPHTTSFFYIHTVIVVLAVFAVIFNHSRLRYAFIGWLMLAAATIGHTFSGGAPLIILLATVPLLLLYVGVYRTRLNAVSLFQNALLFSSVYAIAFFGYELYVRGVNEVFRRASRSILALYSFIVPATTTSGGGGGGGGGNTGGYYSTLSPELLIQTTGGEVMLFFLVFGGVCVLALRSRFDLDLIILWIGGGFLLLALAVLFVEDIPAQRFYQILIIFGMNIAAAVMLLTVTRVSRSQFKTAILVYLVFTFAVLSLISPVAGLVLSPMTDQVPTDDGLYSTAFDRQNSNWNSQHVPEGTISWGQLPLTEIDRDTVVVDRERLDEGDTFRYSSNHARTGKRIEGAGVFGGANRVFFEWNPDNDRDHIVYSNARSKTVVRS